MKKTPVPFKFSLLFSFPKISERSSRTTNSRERTRLYFLPPASREPPPRAKWSLLLWVPCLRFTGSAQPFLPLEGSLRLPSWQGTVAGSWAALNSALSPKEAFCIKLKNYNNNNEFQLGKKRPRTSPQAPDQPAITLQFTESLLIFWGLGVGREHEGRAHLYWLCKTLRGSGPLGC